MPGLVDLIDLISLDVTRGLVQQGLGLGFDGRRFTRAGSPAPSALAITNATNATPIVLTCNQPHGIAPTTKDGYPNPIHAVVTGVEGNTAANAIDDDPDSRARGQNRGVQLTAIDATRFSMAAVSPTTGLIAPLAGNGAYTSGGTIKPALTSGRILMGREHTRFENAPAGAPPYLAFVPVGSEWPKDIRPAHGAPGLTGEHQDQIERRALCTELVLLQLHAWGEAVPPNPRADFDMTQRLYQQVVQSCHLLGVGVYRLGAGTWDDQKEKATQLLKTGHYHVMTIALATPVLEFAMPFIETPLTIDPTTKIQLPDGSPPETGCSG